MISKAQIIKKVAITGYANLTTKEKEIYNSVDMRQIILETAKKCLGKKMSPLYKDYGCAEAVNNIVMLAIGNPVGGGASTTLMYVELKNNKRFKKLEAPLPGDIVISPTGYGNGKIKNGHVGIFGDDGKIWSNNSDTLKFDNHYQLSTWLERYSKKGGFPTDYFRILA